MPSQNYTNYIYNLDSNIIIVRLVCTTISFPWLQSIIGDEFATWEVWNDSKVQNSADSVFDAAAIVAASVLPASGGRRALCCEYQSERSELPYLQVSPRGPSPSDCRSKNVCKLHSRLQIAHGTQFETRVQCRSLHNARDIRMARMKSNACCQCPSGSHTHMHSRMIFRSFSFCQSHCRSLI